jgi:hypothetical protein
VLADVALGEGTEDRVDEGVDDDVTVGVGDGRDVVGDDDAAEDESPAGLQPVDVVAVADAEGNALVDVHSRVASESPVGATPASPCSSRCGFIDSMNPSRVSVPLPSGLASSIAHRAGLLTTYSRMRLSSGLIANDVLVVVPLPQVQSRAGTDAVDVARNGGFEGTNHRAE